MSIPHKNACGNNPDSCPLNEDIEDLSTVLSDSFLSLGSAEKESFGGTARRRKISPYINSIINKLKEKSAGSIHSKCSQLNRNIYFHKSNEELNGVLERQKDSNSNDSLDQECFMFSPKFPRPCFCWKRSFFGCAYCESRFCWTWPGWRLRPYYGSDLPSIRTKMHSYYPFYTPESFKRHSKTAPKQRFIVNTERPSNPTDDRKENCSTALIDSSSSNTALKNSRLVMEEAERKEESERWRERGERGAASEVATLPVKRPWLQQSRVTTKATLEGARHLSSSTGLRPAGTNPPPPAPALPQFLHSAGAAPNVRACGTQSDGPSLNGIFPARGEGEQRQHRGEQTDPDEKPPKLVVNINHLDKASQIPEPLPAPEPEIESKKIDEVDNPEPENSCLIDCLYVTLQCCDCSIM